MDNRRTNNEIREKLITREGGGGAPLKWHNAVHCGHEGPRCRRRRSALARPVPSTELLGFPNAHGSNPYFSVEKEPETGIQFR